VAEEEVNRIMNAVDKNNSGSIDYTGKDLILFGDFLKKKIFCLKTTNHRVGDGHNQQRSTPL